MIHEQMIELMILDRFVRDLTDADYVSGASFSYNGKNIDCEKMIDRYIYLKSEFLKPYVIDNASKED